MVYDGVWQLGAADTLASFGLLYGTSTSCAAASDWLTNVSDTELEATELEVRPWGRNPHDFFLSAPDG